MFAHSGSGVQREDRNAQTCSLMLRLGVDASLVCFMVLAEAAHMSSQGGDRNGQTPTAKDGDRGGEDRRHVGVSYRGLGASSFAAHLQLAAPHVHSDIILMVASLRVPPEKMRL